MIQYPELFQIVDFVPDAIIMINNNHQVVACNLAMENLIGLSKDQMIGRDIRTITFDGKTGVWLAEVLVDPSLRNEFPGRIIEDDSQLCAESVILHQNDGIRLIRLKSSAKPIYDQDMQMIGAVQMIRDKAFFIDSHQEADTAQQELEKAYQQLTHQLDYTNTMIDNLNEMFYTFDLNMVLTFINKKSIDVMGYTPEELIGTKFNSALVDGKDWDWIRKETMRRLETGKSASYVLPWLHRDGHKIYLKINSAALYEDNKIVGGMVLADDITEDIKAREALRISEERLRRVTDNMLDLIAEADNKGNLVYVSPSHLKLLGHTYEEMQGIQFKDLVHPDDISGVIAAYKRVLENREAFTCEQRCRHVEGHYIWTETLGNPLIEDGQLMGVVLCTRDISERKQLEKELRYLSNHDVLTGLYNRTYFETEMERLDDGRHDSVGMIMCDLDGLKLVNDTFGHLAGDHLLIKTGEILKACFRAGDVVARVGGDEFTILLPDATILLLEKSALRIQEMIADYNRQNARVPLSISTGHALRQSRTMSLKEVYKEADNHMYRLKLSNSRSARSAVVQTLLKALEARDFITEGHGERMRQLVVDMGNAMSLPENVINTLGLLAQFHDIGKVGIPDSILFKPSLLTPGEYAEMKRHCEIGHRIALASPELSSLADLILKHHEWWNGQGYPLGLSGEEIPVECRILALADAYDAMTSDRPYRKAMSREEAIREIKRGVGTQFDPILTHQLISII